MVGAAMLFGLPQAAECSDPINVIGNTPGVTWPRGKAADNAAWLRGGDDLIFLGQFESWSRDSSPTEGYVVRCRVDSVLMGYSPEPIATFKRLVKPSYASDRLAAGTRVLAWVAVRAIYRNRRSSA